MVPAVFQRTDSIIFFKHFRKISAVPISCLFCNITHGKVCGGEKTGAHGHSQAGGVFSDAHVILFCKTGLQFLLI